MEKALLDLTIRSYSTSHATHNHSFNQLVIPIEGAILIEVDGHEERLMVGRTAVVAQGAPHTQTASSENKSLILDISPCRLERDGAGRLLDKPFHALPVAAMKLIDYMVLTLNQRHLSPDNQQLWAALLLDAMAQPLREPATRLVGVLHAVEQNPGYPWSTQKMAEQASVSISHLHALFRQRNGVRRGLFGSFSRSHARCQSGPPRRKTERGRCDCRTRSCALPKGLC